jgi:hypothetical protein
VKTVIVICIVDLCCMHVVCEQMFSVHGTADTRKGSQGQGHRLGHRTVISESSLSSLKTLGGGRYSTVQQGVWTADDGQKVG